MQLGNKQFLTHAIKMFILAKVLCATAEQANSKTASEEDEKALLGLVQLHNHFLTRVRPIGIIGIGIGISVLFRKSISVSV